jgi:hypothetical protein
MYVTGGSRVLFAVGEMQAGPRWLTRLNGVRVPVLSVLVMWIVGVLFLLPFPAWQKMVNYITSITVLAYGLGPVVLLILREHQPDLQREFLLPGAGFIAPLAFIASNWIVSWTGYATNSFLFIMVAVGLAIYAAWHHLIAGKSVADFGWRHISWLLAWMQVRAIDQSLQGLSEVPLAEPDSDMGVVPSETSAGNQHHTRLFQQPLGKLRCRHSLLQSGKGNTAEAPLHAARQWSPATRQSDRCRSTGSV